jgi:hypothetical protein
MSDETTLEGGMIQNSTCFELKKAWGKKYLQLFPECRTLVTTAAVRKYRQGRFCRFEHNV